MTTALGRRVGEIGARLATPWAFAVCLAVRAAVAAMVGCVLALRAVVIELHARPLKCAWCRRRGSALGREPVAHEASTIFHRLSNDYLTLVFQPNGGGVDVRRARIAERFCVVCVVLELRASKGRLSAGLVTIIGPEF